MATLSFDTVKVDKDGCPFVEKLQLDSLSDSREKATQAAFLTPEKLIEAASVHLDALFTIGKAVRVIKRHLNETNQHIARKKAELLLDTVPSVLQEKGFLTARSKAGSEDLRNAVIEANVDYQKLVGIQEEQEVLLDFMERSYRTVESALRVTNKAIDQARSSRFSINPNTEGFAHNAPSDDFASGDY